MYSRSKKAGHGARHLAMLALTDWKVRPPLAPHLTERGGVATSRSGADVAAAGLRHSRAPIARRRGRKTQSKLLQDEPGLFPASLPIEELGLGDHFFEGGAVLGVVGGDGHAEVVAVDVAAEDFLGDEDFVGVF